MPWGKFVAVVLLLASLTACKHKPEDDVLDQYKAGESAIAVGDCTAFKNTLTPESVNRLMELERLALECPAAELKKMPPSTMREVVMLRNRLDPARLRTMSADDLLAWMILEKALVVDEQHGLFPHSVRITGDAAVLQLGEKVTHQSRVRVRRVRGVVGLAAGAISLIGSTEIVPIPGETRKFRQINGYWYQQLNAEDPEADAAMTEYAKEEKMPIHELVSLIEQDEFGKIKDNIWNPPGK